MSASNYLKVYRLYRRGLFRALHFYFKPGVQYQEYPQHPYPRINKYFQTWLKYIPLARTGIRIDKALIEQNWCHGDKMFRIGHPYVWVNGDKMELPTYKLPGLTGQGIYRE